MARASGVAGEHEMVLRRHGPPAVFDHDVCAA
jgi:hypothetical protein